MIGIYKYTNKINQKSYIGQSIQIEERKKQHIQASYNKNHINYYSDFHKAIREFGIENFDFEILEQCSKEQLNEREVYWIKYYNSYEDGYNMTPGGDFNPSNVPEIVQRRTKILLENPEINAKLSHKGETNPNAKLTEEDVKEIRLAYKEGKNIRDIYPKFQDKISYSGFQYCWLGKSWKEVMPEVFENNKPINKGGSKKSIQEVYNMRFDYMNGMSKEDLLSKYDDNWKNMLKIFRLGTWNREEAIPTGYRDFLKNRK